MQVITNDCYIKNAVVIPISYKKKLLDVTHYHYNFI